MNQRPKVVAVIGLLLSILIAKAWTARASADDSTATASIDTQLITEINDHSELMANLQYLSDRIGPRLTGSPLLKQANDWTADMFRKYGLTNVHLEGYTIAHAWIRGTAKGRIIAPTEHPLTLASAAWAPSTKGVIRGPVVYFDAKKPEEFAKFHGKLKGAIIITQDPQPLSPSHPVDPNFIATRPMQEPGPPVGQPAAPDPYEKYLADAKQQMQFFLDEGAVAVLRDSGKPHALLNMTSYTFEPFQMGPMPGAFITGEDYRTIFRMLKDGPVQIELQITNSLSAKPVEVYNTVAELKGSEKPDEVVIIGGHLDSWDLATGSTDDGTGAMATLEAARALAKSGAKPKRTIRFVLFSGEEEGLIGSKEYVKAHKADLDKISGVLIHDTGTGRVLTIGMHDEYEARLQIDQVIAPLGALHLLEPTVRRTYGQDSFSFAEVGVPGFWCLQTVAEYRLTHHSQSDTFDKVWKDDINQGAQVLATWAYNTANLPEMLHRRPFTPPAPASNATKNDPPLADPIADADKKILTQVKSDEDQLKKDLTYLTTNIGPRLTGSSQLDQASHWTQDQFKALGLANVHLESWTIANSWNRGTASGRILSPALHELTLAAAGWSSATNGAIKGDLTVIEARKPEDLDQYKGKLAGKIVMLKSPIDLEAPDSPLLTPWGHSTLPLMHPKETEVSDLRYNPRVRAALPKMLADEKPAALLIGSEKMYGLLNMGALSRDYQPSGFPAAYIAREDYLLLLRMAEAGAAPQIELNLQPSFSGKPVDVYNTVAEIPGTEKPEEVVIIGGHLDSWDLGTGATDNGTGSMAVLEAARALQKLGLKPKRTIRFILFTGEEQGLNGSRAYVQAHKDDMPKISGVLIHDSGTGKVLTVGLMNNYNVKETMDRVLYPLAEPLGLAEPSLRTEGGTDHIPFDAAGVPAFWCMQDPVDYEKTHHSQADVLDRVRWDDLTEGAQVLAVFAYNVAQWPEMLPRKAKAAEQK